MNSYNFSQSLDGLDNIEADNINTSNLNVGSLVVNSAKITTLSNSNLVNCTTSTIASADNDLVNKKYVVDNFVDRTNNLTQDINGAKTFTTDLTVFNASSPSLFLRTALTGNSYSYIRSGVSLAINNQLPTGNIIFQINGSTRATINSTQFLLTSTTFLTTNDMKSRDPTASHSLLSDITTGTLAISSSTATNTINGATQLNQQATFNNFTPISSVASPTEVNHLTRKDYVDNNFVDRTNNLAQSINGIKTFSNQMYTEGILTRDGIILQDVLAPKTNWVQTYVAGTMLNFITIFNLGRYGFKTRDNLGSETTSFEITNPETVIRNNLVSNGQSTFNNFTPISSVSAPTAVNHLTRKDYVDNNFVDKTNAQDIFGVKTFGSTSNFNGTTSIVVAGYAQFDGTTAFTNNLPTSTITATTANQLVNYTTLTTQGYITSSSFLSASNAWTGFNSFNTNLPTSTITATTANQLVNYTTLTTQGYTSLSLVQGNANSFTNTNAFTGDVTLSKTKNNSSYATYNGLNSTYIGYMTEVPTGIYTGISNNTQYQLGAITLDSTNVGFWTCNYEVEINSITAGSISKIYVFVSDNNVSSTVPIGLPGAKANNFSTQTYTAGDSTYHSGSFSFLQSTTSIIYAVQLKIIISSGTYQRKGQIRMLRIL